MATARNSITLRTTYESPCGRIKVVRMAAKDFALYEDGEYVGSFDYSFQAEHEGGVWLHEQAAQVAVMAQQAQVQTQVLAAEAAQPVMEMDAGAADAVPAADVVMLGADVSEGATWPTFSIGAGVSRVLVSTDRAAGAHLVINGVGINDYANERMGLHELRQLRDHLSALLDDARLAAALGEPPTPPRAPVVQVRPHWCDDSLDPRYGREITWVDYIVETPAGHLEATLSAATAPQLFTTTEDLGDLTRWVALAPALQALLQHPAIRAALIRAQAGAPQRPLPKAA